MQAYCVKCRTKREMKDPKQITMKNGRPATRTQLAPILRILPVFLSSNTCL